jgi:hypothetical protein
VLWARLRRPKRCFQLRELRAGERFVDTWPFTGKKTDLLEGGLRIPMVIACNE